MDSDADEDGDRPQRRAQKARGRLEDQRAGFTTHPSQQSSSTTLLYGQAIYPERATRPAPKSAGSASLPPKPKPARQDAHDDLFAPASLPRRTVYDAPLPTPRRRSRPPVMTTSLEDSSLFQDHLLAPHSASTVTGRRRGSAVSTCSSHSLPHSFGHEPNSTASLNRYSVSSFGARTINTVGDMSMSSSMPLLDQSSSRRRGSADSAFDANSSFGWSPSGRIRSHTLAAPAPAYFADFSFARRSPSPAHRLPRLQNNPLRPLRPRLARALAATRRSRVLGAEVQLVLELVEALESCLSCYRGSPAASPIRERGRTLALAGSSGATAVGLDPLTPDRPLHPTTGSPPSSTATTPPMSASHDASLAAHRRLAVEEVRLLVRELIELIPDAQLYLRNGEYGPLTSPNVTLEQLLASLEPPEGSGGNSVATTSSTGRKPSGGEEAATAAGERNWPARLTRDCRALLEEAGLPSGASGAFAADWLLGASVAGSVAANSGETISPRSQLQLKDLSP